MKNTTHLGLNLPEPLIDNVDIGIINQNFEKLDTANIKYDKVITTQADFDSLVASDTWLNATSVLFVGEFAFDATNNNGNGILIPTTVKRISGTNKTKISILNLGPSGTTTYWGFGYNRSINSIASPVDNSVLDNINVEFSNAGTGSFVFGVLGFANVINCKCTHTGGTGSPVAAFGYCTNMIGCAGVSNKFSFYTCSNLVNCKADTSDSTDVGGRADGFVACKRLTNCTGSASNSGAGQAYVYFGCSYCSNCYADSYKTAIWGGVTTKRDDDSCMID